MSDSYLPGAAVLAHSLRDAGTTKKLAVLVTPETLSADTITQLKSLYDYLIPVERVRNSNPANLYLMGRPDLAFAFTKIALWRQTQFRKLVYLDADVVALRALDELFNIEAPFAAAPDIGWPDAFNSGVMVITPDMGEYWALQTMAATGDSFDGADQGLLNQYFEHRPWQRLKFTYNCTPNAEYQWEPAYRHYKRDISAVHFIGKDKPWLGYRKSASGVYGELLARWWAVHDRHLREPTAAEQAKGETQSTQSGTSLSQLSAQTPAILIEPEAPATFTELSMTEPGEEAENIDQGLTEPTPTVQQRKFSAPEMQWDATRSEPPAQSQPEAANFPSQTYTFSDSHSLFKAPQAYPEPPRDMWYRVPETKPKPAEKPKPIFPWERQADRPAATRVFAEDLPVQPSPPAVSSPIHSFSTVHYEDELEATPGGVDEEVASRAHVSSPKSADVQWQAFQQSNVNAWDSVPGIDNYVRAIMDSHGRHGKTETLQQSTGTEDIGSPLLERRNRRESLILTDFPSAVERPSLPVTPAPLRRPTFWGEERNQAGELPAAEGVPDQTEWNPNEKLNELRRSSLIEFEHLKKDPHPDPPLRALPEHSVLTENDAEASHVPLSGGASPHGINHFDGASEKKNMTAEHHSLGHVRNGSATEDQLKGEQTGEEPAEQPPAPSLDKTQAPEARGARFFAERGFTSQPNSSTEHSGGHSHNSSSSTTSQQSYSTQQSQQQQSSSTSQQIQAGKTTFTLPDFGDATSGETKVGREEVLSPTQTKDNEGERTGQGLF
ncbi:glycogenin glucosyltransferase [Neocucurbitaria cava]|uniref:glycogenin glucosyltransferase n=1 Tax=Neocucurbitaria cava TaxID=798079 RepID=A0A9W8XZ08_9PLEO|nr:glycogenin glucosyltransferase [Neocucurbitaria cava]